MSLLLSAGTKKLRSMPAVWPTWPWPLTHTATQTTAFFSCCVCTEANRTAHCYCARCLDPCAALCLFCSVRSPACQAGLAPGRAGVLVTAGLQLQSQPFASDREGWHRRAGDRDSGKKALIASRLFPFLLPCFHSWCLRSCAHRVIGRSRVWDN